MSRPALSITPLPLPLDDTGLVARRMRKQSKKKKEQATSSSIAAARALLHSDFDPFVQPEDVMYQLAILVFEGSGVMEPFKISREKLAAFLKQVRANYHDRNPYHNWNHAVHVLLGCYRVVCQTPRVLLDVHVLALLFSAICHDLDHSGLTNRHHATFRSAFFSNHHHSSSFSFSTPTANRVTSSLVASPLTPNKPYMTMLAMTPQSPPPSIDEKFSTFIDESHFLERNSIHKIDQILSSDQFDIFSGCSAKQRSFLRTTTEDLILCTDVSDPALVTGVQTRWARHGHFCNNPSLLEIASEEDRNAFFLDLILVILLCADIGIVAEPYPIYVSGLRCLFNETRTHTLVNAREYCKRQIGFLKGYGLAAHQALAEARFIIPGCDLVSRLNANRERFEQELEDSDAPSRLMQCHFNALSSARVEASSPPRNSSSGGTFTTYSNTPPTVAFCDSPSPRTSTSESSSPSLSQSHYRSSLSNSSFAPPMLCASVADTKHFSIEKSVDGFGQKQLCVFPPSPEKAKSLSPSPFVSPAPCTKAVVGGSEATIVNLTTQTSSPRASFTSPMLPISPLSSPSSLTIAASSPAPIVSGTSASKALPRLGGLYVDPRFTSV